MALADPVRRAIVARLSRGPATVNELAAPFDITKQAVSKHIQVLEQAGLVTRTRDAQRRPVHLDAAALEGLTAWIDRYRLDAERNYRRLDALLAAMTDTSDERERTMTNALNLQAPVDTLAMEFTREFDAPVQALFRAHAEPDLVKQWLGPHGLEMQIEEWDFNTHGGYRYVHSTEHGDVPLQRHVSHRAGERVHHPDLRIRGCARHGEHRVHVVRGPRRRPQPAARPVDLPEHRGP